MMRAAMAGRPARPRRAPAPSAGARLLQAAGCLAAKKAPCSCTPHRRHAKPAILPHQVSCQAPAHSAVIDRPDRTVFPASKINPKPNFQTLPQISPRLSPLWLAASRLQSLSLRRARAGQPVSPARGLRGAGDKEAAATLRPPGRQDRPLGDSSEPRPRPPSNPLPSRSRPASPAAPGPRVLRPPAAAAVG